MQTSRVVNNRSRQRLPVFIHCSKVVSIPVRGCLAKALGQVGRFFAALTTRRTERLAVIGAGQLVHAVTAHAKQRNRGPRLFGLTARVQSNLVKINRAKPDFGITTLALALLCPTLNQTP